VAFREDVLAAVETILGNEPGGLTPEALTRRVGQWVGRQLPPGQLIGLLNALPQRFYVGGDDRWRLRARHEIETNDEGDSESSLIGASLRPGCYVVFDLEALGQDVRSPETEIIQIAAQRWTDGQPEEPWVTLVRPASGLVPAHIAKLTNITSEDVRKAPGIEEALAAFFAYAGVIVWPLREPAGDIHRPPHG
jgi:Exonuclease